ncbi:glutathione S-transferase family protein [Nitratireductor indicus]|uniref:Glutathione S-transferase domain-containing protein n=1 Tax=Nitratireductor indicus C115 TaxID=1231190 RepID=K2P2T3_9HYPH|nr:glutathione S-transferase family protein [Nitratireductor indicus]EKF41656.1 glutathione S-transferase domain-containing protein [Nitratireductor indicus C115]MDS1136183.1 glutathione S-transferase family protein [Nitratireductor indicus]SFQ70883.1 glutathione S-transferase [Nitratireductor indicus]
MLRLLYTEASPFARKVRMAALERGVELRLERTTVHPVDRNRALGEVNPLAKIPVLISPEGTLFDSRVICRYIDRRGHGPSLYASEVADPWDILTMEALADGIMDAAVNTRYELVARPEPLRWPEWTAAQFDRIHAGLDRIEDMVDRLRSPHLGALALGAALEYLDFRHPDRPWRGRRPRLAGWLEEFGQSAPMRATPYPVEAMA